MKWKIDLNKILKGFSFLHLAVNFIIYASPAPKKIIKQIPLHQSFTVLLFSKALQRSHFKSLVIWMNLQFLSTWMSLWLVQRKDTLLGESPALLQCLFFLRCRINSSSLYLSCCSLPLRILIHKFAIQSLLTSSRVLLLCVHLLLRLLDWEI